MAELRAADTSPTKPRIRGGLAAPSEHLRRLHECGQRLKPQRVEEGGAVAVGGDSGRAVRKDHSFLSSVG